MKDALREHYGQVYDILVAEVGAREDGRHPFIEDMVSENPASEWRFSGSLGFGGKYWPQDNRVNCYSEDETPERAAAIEQANQRLAELVRQLAS